MVKNRKRRCDTTHYLYVVSNIYTGEQYIGLTVKNPGGVYKTLHRRIQKHLQRAYAESKGWALSGAIRDWGAGAFTFGFLEQVRGRKAAHSRERQLIAEFRPALNTH